MKKMLKKTGVAVLSMAMLLSMGAMTAATASAAGESITVGAGTGLTAGDKVCVYKVATKTASGWAWDKTEYKTAVGADFAAISNYDSSQIKAVAEKLARTVSGTPTATGVVDHAINVEEGYYLVTSAPKAAGLVAQPMLIEVKAGTAHSITNVKTSPLNLTKVITKVENKTDKVATGGKSAEASKGETIHYVITAQIPSYSPDATAIQDFVLTDVCDNTLAIDENTITARIQNNAGDSVPLNAADAVSDVTATTFKVTVKGNDATAQGVKSNGGNDLVVEYDAVLGDNPTISKGLGAGTSVEDTNRADANKNDVELTYGNNYSTGGGSDTDGDGDIDEDDEQPKLKDFADVYTSLLQVNKIFDGKKPAAGVSAEFTLFSDEACTTAVRPAAATDANGIVSFKGLASGTYYLKETKTPDNFKTAAVAKVVLDVDAATKSVYVAPANFTAMTTGGFETTIDNPSLETLPATGGIGTYLFTIGGAAIVLLAGVLFVFYMKKRETEE